MDPELDENGEMIRPMSDFKPEPYPDDWEPYHKTLERELETLRAKLAATEADNERLENRLKLMFGELERHQVKLAAANESVVLLERQRNEARIERDVLRDKVGMWWDELRMCVEHHDLGLFANLIKNIDRLTLERDEARRWAAMLRHSLKHYRREAFEHIFGDRFDEARYEIVRAILKKFREVDYLGDKQPSSQ